MSASDLEPIANPQAPSREGDHESLLPTMVYDSPAQDQVPSPVIKHETPDVLSLVDTEHEVSSGDAWKAEADAADPLDRRCPKRDAVPFVSPQPAAGRTTETSPQASSPPSPKSLDSADADDSARERPCDNDPVVLQTMATLIREHGARSFTHWQRNDAGELEASSISAEDPELDNGGRVRSLVEECLSSGQVAYRLFSSRNRFFVVAAPVPAVADYAITVCFPFNRDTDTDDIASQKSRIHLRCRDVAITAAHLAIVRLQSKLDDSTVVTAANGDEPSLKELCKQMLSQLARALRKALGSPKHVAVGLGILLLVALIPFPHSVSCKITCEPAVRRFVAAPFESKLLESRVLPGDRVTQGQVLAVLDGSDLRTEIAGLQAQLSQAAQRRSAALSSGDASNSELERLEALKLRGEVEMLKERQRNLEIRAPMAGVVVSGNLERKQGSPLSMGDDLFEIAPLEDWIAEVAIPEADIGYVKSGMPCRLSLNAGMGESQSTTINRIHPRNEMQESESVFVAEANIRGDQMELKPGMTGTARISTGLKPLGWILFHRPFEVFRQWIGW